METGPCRAVRYVSDCRSSSREFDPGPVPYFHGDWSWNNFYSHSSPFCWFKKGSCQLQAKVCPRSTGLLLNQACPGKKYGYVKWTSHHGYRCCLGCKASRPSTNKAEWKTYSFLVIFSASIYIKGRSLIRFSYQSWRLYLRAFLPVFLFNLFLKKIS